METEVTTTDQATGQEPQQESQSDSNVDYKALYLDEVNNSKKLRKRSQDAEAKVTEFTTAQETNKVKQMKEQEQFQELSEELQKQLDSTLPYREKWEAHETAQREKYLSKLPKADREKLSNEKLETLKYIASLKDDDSKPQAVKHSAGKARDNNPQLTDPFETLDKEGLNKNWDNILSQYTDQHKKVN